jgi:hypothetical protein
MVQFWDFIVRPQLDHMTLESPVGGVLTCTGKGVLQNGDKIAKVFPESE